MIWLGDNLVDPESQDLHELREHSLARPASSVSDQEISGESETRYEVPGGVSGLASTWEIVGQDVGLSGQLKTETGRAASLSGLVLMRYRRRGLLLALGAIRFPNS